MSQVSLDDADPVPLVKLPTLLRADGKLVTFTFHNSSVSKFLVLIRFLTLFPFSQPVLSRGYNAISSISFQVLLAAPPRTLSPQFPGPMQ